MGMKPDFTNVVETRQAMLSLLRRIESRMGVRISVADALEEAGDDAFSHLVFLECVHFDRDWAGIERWLTNAKKSLHFWADALGTHNPHTKDLLPVLLTVRMGWPIDDDDEPEVAQRECADAWEVMQGYLRKPFWSSPYDRLGRVGV